MVEIGIRDRETAHSAATVRRLDQGLVSQLACRSTICASICTRRWWSLLWKIMSFLRIFFFLFCVPAIIPFRALVRDTRSPSALFSARQVIYMAKPTLHEDRPAPQAQAQSIRDCQVRRGSRRAASFRAKSREATADPEDGGVLIPGMAVIIALNVTSQNVRKPPGDPRQTGWSDYWGGPPCPRQIPSSPSGPRRLGKRP